MARTRRARPPPVTRHAARTSYFVHPRSEEGATHRQMAWRQIHDDINVSTSLNNLSHFAERLYWRLLAQTDTWGRLPGDTVKIRDTCIPRLAVSDTELQEALEELVRAGRVTLYCVDGRWACQLTDFDDNQLTAKMKRPKSRYPDPPSRTPTKPLHDPGPANRETETEERDSSPTAVLQYVELPISESGKAAAAAEPAAPRFHHWDLGELCRSLRGADERSPYALGSVLRGLPEASLATALESLEKRRGRTPRLESEARYLVGTITQMRSQAGLPAINAR